MFPSFLITFRETLEASLVIGILFTLLAKTRQLSYRTYVWKGVGMGIGFAVLLAVFLKLILGGLSGRSEGIFEGVLMLVTAAFLTWMILWVHRQRDIKKKLREKVILHIQGGYGKGIMLLAGSAILREGTETVLYLQASSLTGETNQITGALLGILLAAALGYAIFRFAVRVNLSLIFNLTSIFLILFAAGLVSQAVHEFQEVGIVPIYSFDPLFNISSILDHKSILGSLLRTIFGYTSRPTTLELVSFGGYIIFILWLERFTDRLLLAKSRSARYSL
jgi:high-affinity iron transporter